MVNSVPWCQRDEGGGMLWSKSPDHTVIRSDLNGGRGIFELCSVLAISRVSVA